jgi:tripartite-type tricarboxylate transporter receptor subunit TctC
MRRVVPASFAALAALVLAQPAPAEIWPQKPVRIIVPFAPGGNTDSIGRIIAQHLGEAFGQQFIIENRPGAAGAIAAEAVARSPADGYTLLLGSPSPISIAPLMAKTAYDPIKDFAPVSVIGTNPYALVVHPSLPVTTVGEFVAYVRKEPNKLTYVSSGAGSVVHLSTGLFLKRAGLEMIPVFYKGGMAAVTDVIAGHVSTYFATVSDVLPYTASGNLRLLAVSSEKRVSQIPGVPTFIESGFSGFKTYTWNGLMAPAGTPWDIIERIAKEVARAVKDPRVIERLAVLGVDPVGNTPEEFAAMIAADTPLWAEAIKLASEPEK